MSTSQSSSSNDITTLSNSLVCLNKVSSFPLQLLLFIDGELSLLFFIGEIILFIAKYKIATYPVWRTFVEPLIILFQGILQWCRIKIGKKANIAESRFLIVVFAIFCAVNVIGYIFFFVWQGIVSKFDYVMSICGLALIGVELFFAALLFLVAH